LILSGQENWKKRLVSEYPKSAEALAVQNTPGVAAAVTPQWLLFDSLITGSGFAVNAAPAAAAVTVNAAPSAPAVSSPSVRVQTGLFSKESNAASLVESLKKAGFSAQITKRTVNGGDYFAVMVPPGNDVNKTIRDLKSAGFDSFPVTLE